MLKLRPGQREVAEYTGGLLAVPAVPGAGKTTVLAHLAAELIATGRPNPGKILIVTVMNSAVANFRSRIGDFLVKRELPRTKGYEVKTLHSLAVSILKEKPEFLLINSGFQILDEVKRDQIMAEVSGRWLRDNAKRYENPIKLDRDKDKAWFQKAMDYWERDLPEFFKQAISYIKSHGLSPEEMQKVKSGFPGDTFVHWAAEVYLEYTGLLRSQGLLDFDDLIAEALSLLEQDDGVRMRLQKRWSYIFEDEAQDSNPLQEKILNLLSGGNLVRVGDSNQAILGTFTSAEPEIFRSFCHREEVQTQKISVSSRSTCQVIDLANYLVHWTRTSHPQLECRTALEDQNILPVEMDDPSPNPSVEGYTIGIKQFKDRDTEIAEVAKIAHLQAHRRPENTLAILVPTRAVQQAVAQKLTELGAKFSEVGRVSDEQVRTILDIKHAVDFLAQPHQTEALYRVLSQVLLRELDPEALASVAGLFKRFGVEQVLYPVGDTLPWLELPDQLWDREVYAQFNGAITRLKQWLSASTELPPEDLVLFLAEDLQLQGEQLEIANNLCLQIRQRVTENPAWKLIDIARDLPRLTESLKQFARVIYEQKGFEPQPGVITLLTAHKSKGLEWDTVYIAGVTTAEFPSLVTDDFRSDKWYLKEDMSNPLALFKAQLRTLLGMELVADPLAAAKLAEISERLRLLYVAVTRARKNLLICHHAYRFKKKVGPSLAVQALEKFIREEGEKHVNRLP